MSFDLYAGDCLATLQLLDDASVDAIVTDPPYGLSFMGKRWDYDVPSVEVWAECLRVLKPGGHLLAFAGTRTHHRMAVRIEDAGFEIRDMIAWVYGSGFPKSLDVSKAIDKARDDSADGLRVGAWLRAQREARGLKQKDVAALWPSATGGLTGCVANWETLGKVPKWDQWQMLKAFIGFGAEMDSEVWRLNGRKGTPGNEREIISERPASGIGHGGNAFGGHAEGATQKFDAGPATDAARQWAGWGTALKPALEPITVARKPLLGTVAANVLEHGTGALNIDGCRVGDEARWNPPVGELTGIGSSREAPKGEGREVTGRWPANLIHDGSDEVAGVFGNLARFFYCAKASKVDRGEENNHPTVKPTDLMRYLCRLVTPPGGLVLDPFMGSGSTGKAAMLEGFRFIGCEMNAEYLAIAQARIARALLGDLA